MIFVLFLIAAVALFFLAARLLEWKLVNNWCKRLYKQWSTWLQAAGITVLSLVPFDPTVSLGVWNVMPLAVREIIPRQILLPVAIALFVLAWLAKYVKQEKIDGGDS